ncbi:MAG TPA: M28 family peptidase [Streptomyces sp.]|nr:M28 family peptidase [Streptomyces sp.]
MQRLVSLAALTLVVTPLQAQMATPAKPAESTALTRAAGTITAPDIARKVGIIAHDSMQGRDTPSRGLDMTAQWVADEFERAGLKPGGEKGTWFQRYPILRMKLDTERSKVGFTGAKGSWGGTFTGNVIRLQGAIPKEPIKGEVLLLAGPVDSASVTPALVRGKVLLVAATFTQGSPAVFKAGAGAVEQGAEAIVLTAGRDGNFFDAQVRRAGRTDVSRPGTARGLGRVPVVEVRGTTLDSALSAYGVDLAAMRATTTPVIRVIEGLSVELALASARNEELTAPNTVGIIEGSDPKLKHEYVLFTAHMDHVGHSADGRCRAQGADSICNGADDDASGTVGVVELAQAFAAKGARPKRSMVFMTVSGEERGLWGSAYWADHPTLPLENVVANINIDMIGRNWPDTIVAIGKEHSDLGATLNRVNAAHPELRMTAIDDKWPEENFYRRSDHYNFARKGVPILFFFNGVHDDYHQPSDSPDKIDAEKMARLTQLLFYLGQDLGNAAGRPVWNPDSYKAVVEPGKTS